MAFTQERERSGLGFIAEAKGAYDAGQLLAGAFHSGSTSPYPWPGDPHNNATDSARAARGDAYLVAALYGSTDAARYALGARQSSGAATEQRLYDLILSAIQRLVPAVYSAARSAGLLHDAGDGRGGLQELWRLQVPFSDKWAGHNSGDHSVLDQATIDLVNKLAALGPGVSAVPQPGQPVVMPAGSPLAGPAAAGAAAGGGAFGGGVGAGAGAGAGVGGGGVTQAGMVGGSSAMLPLVLAAALAYALTRKR